ncbi:MAG TPA: ABC transporter substrate-binding protein [Deltaproteobacteria bacterium]|nr:ABC transporter substrate-binding protein [Deltaproteobacteria bacterium]HQI80887.1 ABC transporter substrate-binding protein [Deltaproteobacteria bacterium]
MGSAHHRVLHGFLALCLIVLLQASCSEGRKGRGADIPLTPGGDPVKIGICMTSYGSLAEHAGRQMAGLKLAHDMMRSATARRVDLAVKDPAASPRDYARSVRELIEQDQVAGIVSCASPDAIAAVREILEARPVPFVVTSPCGPERMARDAPPGLIRFCVPRRDQAFACARFLSQVIKARRVGVVVDVGDADAVLRASLFSAEVIRAKGRIMDIMYVQKGQDPAAGVVHLLAERPDAVYIPFSGRQSLAVAVKIRTLQAAEPVLLSGPDAEETLLTEKDRRLDGVYVLTDFAGEAVTSTRGRDFVQFHRKNSGRTQYLGSALATGAEAYFFMLDLLSGAQKTSVEDAVKTAASWKGSLLGIAGSTPRGAIHPRLSFGRVETGFLRGAALRHAASITVDRSDPVADVVTQ